jgi:hypothetical protein
LTLSGRRTYDRVSPHRWAAVRFTQEESPVPVHGFHTVKAGTSSKSFFVHAAEPGSQAGRTGLAADMSGAGAAFVREGAMGPQRVALVPGRVGEHVEGGFVEVDPDLLPGVYQFGAPEAMLAEGSTQAILVLRFPGAEIEPVEVQLVAYDPQDPKCIGMTQLGDERRHEFLRRALPRLTEQELSLGEAAERELAGRLTEQGGGA